MVLKQYEDYLKEQEFPGLEGQEPGRVVGAVIKNKFHWALEAGMTVEELFHAGVEGIWTAITYSEAFPKPEDRTYSHYYQAVFYGIQKYLREMYLDSDPEDTVSFSVVDARIDMRAKDNHRGGDDATLSVIQPVSSSPYMPDDSGFLLEMIQEIIRVVEDSSVRWRDPEGTKRKFYQTLFFLATGHSGSDIGKVVWARTRERVRQRLNNLRDLLKADEKFMKAYGGWIQQGRRSPRRSQLKEGDTVNVLDLFGELFPEDKGNEELRQHFLGIFPEYELEVKRLISFADYWEETVDEVGDEQQFSDLFADEDFQPQKTGRRKRRSTNPHEISLPDTEEFLELMRTSTTKELASHYRASVATVVKWYGIIPRAREVERLCKECGATFTGDQSTKLLTKCRYRHTRVGRIRVMPPKEELLAMIQISTAEQMAEHYTEKLERPVNPTVVRGWLRSISAGRVCFKCGEIFSGREAGRRYAGHMAYHYSFEPRSKVIIPGRCQGYQGSGSYPSTLDNQPMPPCPLQGHLRVVEKKPPLHMSL